jgi:YggT family protein
MSTLLVNFIQLLAAVLWVLILARVIISWVMPMGGGGLVAFVYQVTEPILAPIRRILPPTAGFDFSPLIAILLISAILRLVVSL